MVTAQKHAVLAYIRRGDGAIAAVWNRKYHCWGFPGGKVEEGESFDYAIRRELREEIGAEIRKIWFPELDISPTYSEDGYIRHTFDVVLRYNGLDAVEVNTGVMWATRGFLEQEPKTGEWFRKFFAEQDRKNGIGAGLT